MLILFWRVILKYQELPLSTFPTDSRLPNGWEFNPAPDGT
jgi:hypothetical protein